MHSVIIEEEKHDRREDILIKKTHKRRGKTCHTNNTRDNYDNMDAYLNSTLEFY